MRNKQDITNNSMHDVILIESKRAESPAINSAGQRPVEKDTGKREALQGRNPHILFISCS
jgi:hypothetical protein